MSRRLRQSELDDLVEAVRDTAAREIMPRFRSLSPKDVRNKSGPTDQVTDADQLSEARIGAAVQRIWPDAVVIGEEAVAENPALTSALGSAPRCVVIDPIDGTGNFAAGVAVFGVIVAVVQGAETVFGLLYDPVIDDWMFASRGEGAWYAHGAENTKRISTRDRRSLENCRGFLPLEALDGAARAALMGAFAPVRQAHDLRCSCHEYRQLASGQADFLVSFALHPWDHAAGALLVQEAGGWAGLDGGRQYTPAQTKGRLVAASNPGLGGQLQALLDRAAK